MQMDIFVHYVRFSAGLFLLFGSLLRIPTDPKKIEHVNKKVMNALVDKQEIN